LKQINDKVKNISGGEMECVSFPWGREGVSKTLLFA
jgi:hypothetical protein